MTYSINEAIEYGATFEDMLELVGEDPEDWEEPFDLDMGFDPYMGEYTWDC